MRRCQTGSGTLVARCLAVFIVVALTSGCESLARSSSPEDSPETLSPLPNLHAQIVFQSDELGNWDIYLLELRGTERPIRRALTRHDSQDRNPSFSPDGQWIAFSSDRSGDGDIYIMDANGDSLRRLTDHDAYEGAPQFSPDGGWILFEGERDGSSEIYRVSLDGTKVNRLTDSSTRKLAPVMSPDGRHFAYMEKSWIRWHVALQNWDSGEVNVVSGRGGACRPSFSPDGKWLAYVGTEQADKTDIWIYELSDGDGVEESRWRIPSRSNAHNYDPSFRSDGQHFSFASTSKRGRNEQWDLFVADANGRSLAQLTDTPTNERFPNWNPSP